MHLCIRMNQAFETLNILHEIEKWASIEAGIEASIVPKNQFTFYIIFL